MSDTNENTGENPQQNDNIDPAVTPEQPTQVTETEQTTRTETPVADPNAPQGDNGGEGDASHEGGSADAAPETS